MDSVDKVSVHGGHSGQFCNHATDSLEEVVKTYIASGFKWVGITEHAPGISLSLLYTDQRAAGLTPERLYQRFAGYMTECRRLQQLYCDRIKIYAAMETETYSGYEHFIPQLIEEFKPDYIVGSVHFVNDLNFDYSPDLYMQAARSVGGVDQLYLAYFDLQYDMIRRLRPSVVGHFDLIRIFDPDYQARLESPAIAEKVRRNLELVKELDLILDFNLRSLAKGATEPYVSTSILTLARQLEISVVPGDDSHGCSSVGNFIDEGIARLRRFGFDTDWKKPVH